MTTQTIRFHGFMAKKYGKTVKLAGENMFQLMNGLISRFGPGFKEDVRTNDWHLCLGKVKPGCDLGEEDLQRTFDNKEVLHFVPAVKGASAAVRIIIGVVLIAVGVYTGNIYVLQAGIALTLGGVVEILTKPKNKGPTQAQDQRGSSIYNGALNVTTQGGPIPLIYGRVHRASSVIISTDFSSDEA